MHELICSVACCLFLVCVHLGLQTQYNLYICFCICRWYTCSSYTKLRIIWYHSQGYKPYTIAKLLCECDGVRVSRYGIAKFLKVYHATGSIRRRPGSGWISKITAEIKELVEQQMQQDDETTAYQLHRMINESGYDVSLRTILRCCSSLGWTFSIQA